MPEQLPPDHTLGAIYDVINTMQTSERPPATANQALLQPEANPAPKFGPYRQPFGPDYRPIPIAEQKAAGTFFAYAISDILIEQEARYDRLIDGAVLRCKCRYEGRVLSVLITQSDRRTNLIMAEGRTVSDGPRFSYTSDMDGALRRIDRDDPDENLQRMRTRLLEEREPGPNATVSEEHTAVHALARQARNFKAQMELEAELGVNNLPIGMDEASKAVDDLRAILAHRIS